MFNFLPLLAFSAFANWNARIYALSVKGGVFMRTAQGLTLYDILFKDHGAILDLLEGMDHMFSLNMEAYYGLSVSFYSACYL